MKSINIKGKEYIPVNERIKHFREEYGPGWSIVTEIIECNPERVLIKASVLSLDSPGGVRVASTGHAYEEYGSTFINKTSYVENCETSAIGRALGNLGIGIDTSVASAEEVQNAQLNQEKKMYDKECGACGKQFKTGYEPAQVCWNCKQKGKTPLKPLSPAEAKSLEDSIQPPF